jgi:poly-beta-1,6-N-acetyl-D-glucosamine biosynthesis protein PgaD
LIFAEHVPGWVRWRDALLTTIMWMLFLFFLAKEFELFLLDFLELFGVSHVHKDVDWQARIERLSPFLLTVAILAAFLLASSLLTMGRRRRGQLLPSPAPLDAADEARRSGLDQAALIAARDARIVVVDIGTDGSHRVTSRPGK